MISLDAIDITAGDDDEERRRREAEMRASMEADDIADSAIAGLGDLDLPDEAPRQPASAVMAEARGSTWRDQPGAQPTGEHGVMFPPAATRPAPTIPGELQMPPDADDTIAPRRGSARRAEMDLAFDESLASSPPTADDMRRSPGPVPQTPRMGVPAVTRGTPAPMDAPPSALGAPTAPAPSAASPSASPMASEQLPAGSPKKPPMPERGRMDEGLPSEADIGSARDMDIPRRILHALGSGLAGYSGRSATPFRSNADALQQRRDAGMQRAQTAKGDAIERQDRLGREESQAELQRASLEQRGVERQASQAMAARRLELTDRQLGSRLEASERTRAQDAQLDDPDSTRSRQARTLLLARLSQMPEAQRRAALEAIGGQEALATITGRQARDLIAGNVLAPPAPSRGRSGTGEANPVRSGQRATPETRAELEAEGVRLGLPAVALRGLSIRDLQARVLSAASTEATAERNAETAQETAARTAAHRAEGVELIPGSGIRSGGPLQTGEDARWRDGYATAQSSMAGLNRVEVIAQRYGRTGAISPSARAELVPELTMLRQMVAAMGGTGVINPTEVPTITAALPDPTNPEQATFETFGRRLQQWRAILSDGVQRRAMTLGVDEEGQRRLVQGLRSGQVGRAPQRAAAAPTQTFDATINGTVRRFPTEEARQRAAAIAAERGDTFEAANAAR